MILVRPHGLIRLSLTRCERRMLGQWPLQFSLSPHLHHHLHLSFSLLFLWGLFFSPNLFIVNLLLVVVSIFVCPSTISLSLILLLKLSTIWPPCDLANDVYCCYVMIATSDAKLKFLMSWNLIIIFNFDDVNNLIPCDLVVVVWLLMCKWCVG
jgi:hypothetical protein